MEISKNRLFLLYLVNLVTFPSFNLYFWPFPRLFSAVNKPEINLTLNPDYFGHCNGFEMLKNNTAMQPCKIGRKKYFFFINF